MIEKGNTAATRKPNPADIPFNDAWDDIRAALHKEFGVAAFKSWIAPVALQGVAAGVLTLSVPTRFMRDWVKTHYADRIRHLAAQKFPGIARVEIVIATAENNAQKPQAPVLDIPANSNAEKDKNIAVNDALSSPLDPRFTFANFITGPSNDMAASAAKRVAESDAVTFNPLFIHGGVGLGKTHLLQAAAAELRARNPSRKVLYMSAEKFMYQFVRAIRFKDTMSFKEQFRSVDVLMIDDIQFICGKEATQEEFFHTFNALIGQGKQIVVSADRAPSALDGLDERLRSRLGGGLAVDIRPADESLRQRILAQKCAMLKRDVPQNVLDFLAAKITASVRELEGALNRVIAQAELTGNAVTLAGAEALLQDILRSNNRRVSVEDIQGKVSDHYDLRPGDMTCPRRERRIARPRQIAMYLAKALTEHSLPEIGRKFGGRDHTTIMHGVRKIEELLQTDSSLKEDIGILKQALGV